MDLRSALGAVPLFDLLGQAATDALAEAGSVVALPSGSLVCAEGEPGDSMYVVLDGSLDVTKGDGSGDSVTVATLRTHDFVGEMSLLGGDMRSATVTCSSDCQLFELQREAFINLIVAADSPQFALAITSAMARRVSSATSRVVEEEMEQRLLVAERTADRHRQMSQLVAGVAHELNTPLGIANTAIGMIESRVTAGALADIAAPDAAATRVLDDVIEAGDLAVRNLARANKLIESFKKVSVDQSGGETRTVDLGTVIDDVVALYSINGRRAGIDVTVDDRRPLEHRDWTGDPGLVSQVITNLLQNAERHAYSGDGGPVEITLGAADGQIALDVADRGAGIAIDVQSQMFTPFFTTARNQGGSGLGLAIVHNIVTEGLGGTITVASEVSTGTTFTLRFPISTPG